MCTTSVRKDVVVKTQADSLFCKPRGIVLPFMCLLMTQIACGSDYLTNPDSVTWKPLPLDSGGTLQDIEINPRSPNTIYALCDVGGVYKSVDYGKNWKMMNNGLAGDNANYQVCDMAMDMKNPDVLYILTGTSYSPRRGGVFKSVDGGESWQLLTRRIWSDGNGTTKTFGKLIAIDPEDSSIIYAGSLTDGAFKSEDAGKTWTNLGLKGKHVSFIVVDRRGGSNILYVGARGKGGLYKTVDNGKQWEHFLPGLSVWDMAFKSGTDSGLYIAAGKDGVHESLNGGKDWRKVSKGISASSNCVAVVNVPDSAKTLYCVSNGPTDRFIYKTDDAGNTWRKIPDNYGKVAKNNWTIRKASWVGLTSVKCLAVDPTNSRRVYIGDWHSVFVSRNAGESWEVLPKGLETLCVYTIKVSPVNPDKLFVGTLDMGLFVSSDCGKSFRHPGVVSKGFAVTWDEVLSVSPSSKTRNNVFAAATRDWKRPMDGAIIKSANGGMTWKFAKRLPKSGGLSVARSHTNDDVVYVLVERSGIYKSIDGGINWQMRSNGLPTEAATFGYWTPSSVHVSPEDDNVVFVRDRARGIFRTIDGGRSWKRVSSREGCASLEISPTDSNTVFAGYYNNGLWKSADGGNTWKKAYPSNKGLMSSLGVRASSKVPGQVFVAGSSIYDGRQDFIGVFVSTDNGESWRKLKSTGLGHDVILCLELNEEKNRIYVGTSGGGAFEGILEQQAGGE